MIQDLSDAEITIEITDSKTDVLNEVRMLCFCSFSFMFWLISISKLALSANKGHLAFSLDTGVVGVVDLSNNVVTKMQDKHENVGFFFAIII